MQDTPDFDLCIWVCGNDNAPAGRRLQIHPNSRGALAYKWFAWFDAVTPVVTNLHGRWHGPRRDDAATFLRGGASDPQWMEYMAQRHVAGVDDLIHFVEAPTYADRAVLAGGSTDPEEENHETVAVRGPTWVARNWLANAAVASATASSSAPAGHQAPAEHASGAADAAGAGARDYEEEVWVDEHGIWSWRDNEWWRDGAWSWREGAWVSNNRRGSASWWGQRWGQR